MHNGNPSGISHWCSVSRKLSLKELGYTRWQSDSPKIKGRNDNTTKPPSSLGDTMNAYRKMLGQYHLKANMYRPMVLIAVIPAPAIIISPDATADKKLWGAGWPFCIFSSRTLWVMVASGNQMNTLSCEVSELCQPDRYIPLMLCF